MRMKLRARFVARAAAVFLSIARAEPAIITTLPEGPVAAVTTWPRASSVSGHAPRAYGAPYKAISIGADQMATKISGGHAANVDHFVRSAYVRCAVPCSPLAYTRARRGWDAKAIG